MQALVTYRLVTDFNWFGKTIPEGTRYIQSVHDQDRYNCMVDGNWVPWMDLTFHTIKAPWACEYFVIDDVPHNSPVKL